VASSYGLLAHYNDIDAYGFFLATYISHGFYYVVLNQFNAMVHATYFLQPTTSSSSCSTSS
jgi:hypothetical protein